MKRVTKRERQRLERALSTLIDHEAEIKEVGANSEALSNICDALAMLVDEGVVR